MMRGYHVCPSCGRSGDVTAVQPFGQVKTSSAACSRSARTDASVDDMAEAEAGRETRAVSMQRSTRWPRACTKVFDGGFLSLS
jgi:hypothetical protein